MNRTGKSNAKKGPEEDYNAFKDFIDRETEAHIISRWMVFAGMTDMKGIACSGLLYSEFLYNSRLANTCKLTSFFSAYYPPIRINMTNG